MPKVINRRHLQRALETRQKLISSGHTDIFRLIHGAGDGFPGLYIDVYNGHFRLEAHDESWAHSWLEWRDTLLATSLVPKSILAVVRDKKGKAKTLDSYFGLTPHLIVGKEFGLRYALRLNEPDALGTGLFADMRLVRQRVRQEASGKRVLNCFAHAGAFGVVAAVGGATRVDHLDAARKCAPWSALNLALNGINPRSHRFLVEDAFKFLKKVARKGSAYELIICDPPATSIAPGGKRWTTKDHLDFFSTHLTNALAPHGSFIFSTNDRSLSLDVLHEEMQSRVSLTGRKIKKISSLPIDIDYPEKADAPRLRTMRGVWVTLAD